MVWDARRYRYHGGVRVRARLGAGGPVTSFHYFEYLQVTESASNQTRAYYPKNRLINL